MSQGLACNDGALNPAGYCANRSVAFETFMAPAGAACSACHDAPSTTAHVRTMTAPDGTESCALCHGIGKAYDAQVVHVLPP
jgi:predicted CXXCH cytochrome family protein